MGSGLTVRPPSGRFGPVIRELRESRGWSQEHLAAQASLNRSYMGEIERSAAMPSLVTAEKLAHAFGLALSVLILRCEQSAAAPAVASARRPEQAARSA